MISRIPLIVVPRLHRRRSKSGPNYQFHWQIDSLAGTTNGAEVGTWLDSVNNTPLSQATGTNKPLYETAGIGGKPSLQFSTSDYMTYTAVDALQWTHFFVATVGQVSTPTTTAYLRYGSVVQIYVLTTGVLGIDIVKSGGAVMEWRSAASAYTFGATPHVFEYAYDSTVLTVAPVLKLDGAPISLTLAAGNTTGTRGVESGTVYIGGHASSNPILGMIGEYSKIIGNSDQSAERHRLATKFGITVQ